MPVNGITTPAEADYYMRNRWRPQIGSYQPDSRRGPVLYVSIAFSPTTGLVGFAWNGRSVEEVQIAACRKIDADDAQCYVWASNGYVALATTAQDGRLYARGAWSAVQRAAENSAYSALASEGYQATAIHVAHSQLGIIEERELPPPSTGGLLEDQQPVRPVMKRRSSRQRTYRSGVSMRF